MNGDQKLITPFKRNQRKSGEKNLLKSKSSHLLKSGFNIGNSTAKSQFRISKNSQFFNSGKKVYLKWEKGIKSQTLYNNSTRKSSLMDSKDILSRTDYFKKYKNNHYNIPRFKLSEGLTPFSKSNLAQFDRSISKINEYFVKNEDIKELEVQEAKQREIDIEMKRMNDNVNGNIWTETKHKIGKKTLFT